jgi:NADH dehydrogenase [ubiquinone] 1 alpha subcomplex assembly factor 7
VTEVKQVLLDRIAAEGPLPFEEFQRVSLYHPKGFFGGEVLRSQKAGDFLTSPEVSPLFGVMLARFVDRELGATAPSHETDAVELPTLRESEGGDRVTIAEVAAGSGSLLHPLLRTVESDVDAWAVEVAPPAQAMLEKVVPGRVTDDLTKVPNPRIVIANELLDNIPVAIATRQDGEWRERWVGRDGDALVLIDAEPRPQVERWCERFGFPCPDGGVVEVQLEAGEWLRAAIDHVGEGTLVFIDYGDETENLAPRRQDGTLRTYRSHHLGPHPLDEPGETDITVDVNFTAMRAIAEEAGATVEVHRQDGFLAELGLRQVLSDTRREALEAARSGDVMRQMQLKSRANEAETLMHPRGLGDFRVLIARV